MPKIMNNRWFPVFFWEADKGGGAGSAGKDEAGDGDDQDDDQDDPDADEGGDAERKYTQSDLDKAIARTIAKERRRAERAAAKQKGKDGSGDSGNDGDGDGGKDARARREAENKASRLEIKVACYEADVAKDAVDDVAALARAYMAADEDLDLEEAIEKVVKKYPQFKKPADDAGEEKSTGNKAWGQRQHGKSTRMDGVEAAFMKKNPGLKV